MDLSAIILGIVAAIAGCAVIFGFVAMLQRKSGSKISTERDALQATIKQEIENLEALITKASHFAGKGQLEFLSQNLTEEEANLAKEKENLKAIETKLDSAQHSVEQKESQQQELKSAKEEDEMRLTELMERYSDISNESITLEQRLAASLQNLDSILGKLEMTGDQRAALEELQNTLTGAGGRMRDLLTEYQTVNERLEMLTQQHEDLEMEYTKLVEQQLGE